MHSSHSILQTIVERARMITDDPDQDSKYTNQMLTTQVVGPAYAEVLARLSMNSACPILIHTTMEMEEDTECYTLPPNIQEVIRVATYDDTGRVTAEWMPRNEFAADQYRQGWTLQGNMICFRPYPGGSEEFSVLHTSNGNVLAHLATDGNLLTSTTLDIVGGAVSLGLVDRRANAYCGCVLRIITSTVVEERTITAYNSSTGVVTVRLPFTISTGSGKTYEIIPQGSENIMEAVAMRSALKLGVIRKASDSHQRQIQIEYMAALKTVHDNLANMQGREGKFWILSTVDNMPDQG